ncbi:MAG TPA: hypothetical protein DIS62_02965 [Candidatus Kerfeldbacteria bacterium]|nr:hypothetical protein [Candidatus Kerfeldbacteria bacterium]
MSSSLCRFVILAKAEIQYPVIPVHKYVPAPSPVWGGSRAYKNVDFFILIRQCRKAFWGHFSFSVSHVSCNALIV